MKKSLTTLCLSLGLLVAAQNAQAYVEEWHYTVDGIFTWWQDTNGIVGNGNNVRGTGTYDNAFQYDAKWDAATQTWSGPGSEAGYNSLAWGNQEKTQITLNAAGGTVKTTVPSGPEYNGAGMTLWAHNATVNKEGGNNPGHPSLWQAEALLRLNLEEADTSFATTLQFYYLETANTGNTPDDIFFLTDPSLLVQNTFEFDGDQYQIDFMGYFELQELTGDYLTMAQNALISKGVAGVDFTTPLYGWRVAEGESINFETNFQITLQGGGDNGGNTAVPEPSALLLFGAGLAGLGWFGRRRGGAA